MPSSSAVSGAAKILTVFHDLVACPLSERNPQADMHDLFDRVDAAAKGVLGRRAIDLMLEWRSVHHFHHAPPPAMVEHFVDIGISTMTAGRKAQAVAQKIRNDVAFFLEAHSGHHGHAVVLAVSDASQFSDELQSLSRAGVHAFVVAASGAAPACVSSTCHFLGNWRSTDKPASAGSAQSAAAVAAAAAAGAATAAGADEAAGALDEAAGALDEEAVAAAIEEACGRRAPAAPWVPKAVTATTATTSATTTTTSHTTARPFFVPQFEQSFFAPQLAFEQQPPLLVLSAFGGPSSTVESKGDGSLHDLGHGTPSRTWRRQHAAQPTFVDRTGAKLARGPVHGFPGFAAGGSTAAGAMTAAVPSVTINNTTTAANNTAAASTAPFDPYRIMFGTLHRPSDDVVRIVDRDGAVGHNIPTAALDFDYCWVRELPVGGAGTVVCCRLHKSGRVTDIRMCGEVARTIRGEFGFIRHELFPDNLYFRLSDVDPATSSSSSASGAEGWAPAVPDSTVSQGDVVAFRVGRKGERRWAMRVWKAPKVEGVVAIVGAPAGSSRIEADTAAFSATAVVARHKTHHRNQDGRGRCHVSPIAA